MNKILEQVDRWSPRTILAGVLILSASPLLIVEMFPGQLKFVMDPASYLVFHNTAEFFSIMVSLSMFGISWYTYEQSKDRHALFLGAAFLAIGLMDFMHTMSMPSMPDFITPNDPQKSVQFWIPVRMFQAIAFLASAYVYSNQPVRWLSKWIMVAFSLFVSALVFAGMIFFQSHMPTFFVLGVGVTPLKEFFEYLVIGLLGAATVAYWRRMERTGDRLLIYYLAAFIVSIFSELPLAFYARAFDTYNVLGHINKIIAFFLIYYGIYRASVRDPYIRLAEAGEGLRREVAERERAEKALQKSHEELEERVKERTQDLQRANVALKAEIEERSKVEDALRKSEERLRSLAENVPCVLMRFDRQLRVVYLNKQSDRYNPNPIERMIGRTNREMGMPEHLCDLWDAAAERVFSTGNQEEIEFDFAGPSGMRTFALKFAPEFGPKHEVQFVLGVSTDITERRRMEEELRRSRDELEMRVQERTEELRSTSLYARSLIEASLDPLVTISSEGKVMDVNEATIKATGAPREELIGTDFFSYFTQPEKAREGYQQVFARGFVTDYPLTIRHKEGRLTEVLYNAAVYKDTRGDVMGVFAAARDITARKRAEAAVQKERRRLYDVLETVPVMICLLTPDYHVSFANRSFREKFGEAGGRHCYEYCFGFPGPCEFCESYKVLETGKPHHWEVTSPDGKSIFDAYDYPFTDVDGSPLILEMDIDITERRQAEKALRKAHEELQAEMAKREKAEQQLLQAQRLESIGTLTGGIAHDINNILGPIVINSEMALMDLPKESGVRNYLELILKSGLRGKDLVRQMLLFSRKSEKKQEVLPLSPLIKETFKLLRSSLPTTIHMRLILETESDAVYADPSQVQQVIINLCTNAAYAMRGTTGSIELSLQAITFGSMDLPEADMQPGDYLVLSVKDTGAGMEEEVRKRVFEPFFTTKPVGEGTGLGLSVVYGIVKSHRGRITVYSEPGRGSIFRVYLPKAETRVLEKAEAPKPIPKGKERILFVDDEEIIVKSVQNMLEHLGYNVTVAMDSEEALKLFSGKPSEFDLVMTDQTMPAMTGEDLGKELMRIRPDIPVILCTGYSDLISSEKAMAMGFRGFIMKPFTLRESAELIRRVLDQKGLGNK